MFTVLGCDSRVLLQCCLEFSYCHLSVVCFQGPDTTASLRWPLQLECLLPFEVSRGKTLRKVTPQHFRSSATGGPCRSGNFNTLLHVAYVPPRNLLVLGILQKQQSAELHMMCMYIHMIVHRQTISNCWHNEGERVLVLRKESLKKSRKVYIKTAKK